jgi:hypothetical protein
MRRHLKSSLNDWKTGDLHVIFTRRSTLNFPSRGSVQHCGRRRCGLWLLGLRTWGHWASQSHGRSKDRSRLPPPPRPISKPPSTSPPPSCTLPLRLPEYRARRAQRANPNSANDGVGLKQRASSTGGSLGPKDLGGSNRKSSALQQRHDSKSRAFGEHVPAPAGTAFGSLRSNAGQHHS